MNSLSKRLMVGSKWIVNGLRWRFSEAGQKLLGPEDLNLNEHLRQGAACVVKHGLHRTVYRIQLAGFSIFWKHCRINGIGSYLRQWIRPPKARLEFDRAQALIERGIATIEPLAWAKNWYRYSGPSHLITRELEGGVSLQTYLFDHQHGPARREAAVRIGRYLARLHEAGVVHPDLHPGNILVVYDRLGEPRFHLIDIHNVSIGRSLTLHASRSNLAIFNRFFIMRSTRSDRARFWQSYAALRNLEPAVARDMCRDIEKKTMRSNQILWRDRDRRCWDDNRNFRRVDGPIARGHAIKDLDDGVLQRFLADPDFPFREPGTIMLKDSETSTVAEVVIPTSTGPRRLIYKRFRLKKRLAAPANRVRISAALRSWQMGHALIDRGLPTPRPWLVLHHRGWMGPREGYLLCEIVEDSLDVREFLDNLPRHGKWKAIANLARTLCQFHDSGLTHRDLKAANLLVTRDPEGSAHFHLIDLVGVRIVDRVPMAVRARNLSRLNVSFLKHQKFTMTDCLRFLRAYLCWGLHGRAGWKIWWKAIAEASQRKVARNQQTGRLIA